MIESCYFVGRWGLKQARPPEELLPRYGRILHTAALNPVEKDVDRGGEIVQLHGCSHLPAPNPQYVSLGPSPSAPFDNYDETESEQLLAELPLQSLDLAAPRFIPKVEGEGIHPFIGTKTNGPELGLKPPGIGRLARPRQAAHDDEFRARIFAFHRVPVLGPSPNMHTSTEAWGQAILQC